MSFWEWVQLALIVAKLWGKIDWNWILVLSPIIFIYGLGFVIYLTKRGAE